MVLHSQVGGVTLLGSEGDDVLVRVGAGLEHDAWVSQAVANGWHGLENLSLIPGQVGASAVQNLPPEERIGRTHEYYGIPRRA